VTVRNPTEAAEGIYAAKKRNGSFLEKGSKADPKTGAMTFLEVAPRAGRNLSCQRDLYVKREINLIPAVNKSQKLRINARRAWKESNRRKGYRKNSFG